MARKFTFWYKKEIEAPSLEKAIKIEKKTKIVLSSVEHVDESPQELTPAIGFYDREEEY